VKGGDKGKLVKVYKAPYVYKGKTKETRRVRVYIYVPQRLAEQVGISLDPEVDDYAVIVAADGRLIVRPVKLEELARLEEPVRSEELAAACGGGGSPREVPAVMYEERARRGRPRAGEPPLLSS